jgi:HK97 family phage portal protein
MGFLAKIGRALQIVDGATTRPERRASGENPSTPLSEIDCDDDFYAGCVGEDGHGSAGVRVNVETALRLSPVWRGTFLIANTVAKLPCYVYERDEDGEGKHYASDHPAYYLLRHEPNAEIAAFTFFQVVTAQAVLAGDGYAYIARNGDGSPRALVPLLLGTVTPIRIAGQLVYMYQAHSGRAEPIAAEDMYHIRGPGLDALTGMRLTRKAKESLGAAIAAQTYGAKWFENGAEPRVVFESKNTLTPEQRTRIKEGWQAMHSGVANMHKSAILEKDVSIKSFGADPESSQLLETRKFTVQDVANWLGVPSSKLGDSSRAAYNSLEQDNLSFLGESMEPWLVVHEQEARRKLLTEEEKRSESHAIEFMRLALMRADSAARAAFYHSAIGDGWMNADEIRARENLNPMPDGAGKRFYRPMNMAPVGGEDDQKLMEFLRETWLSFTADGTVSDVQANLTDIKALAKAVGLPVNDEYTEPYLPVVAESGPLVSGDTIKDENGDIVGADTLPAGQGDDSVVSGSTTKDDGGRAARSARASAEALRQMIIDTARRMVKRLAVHAIRAAKAGPAELQAFMATGMDEHRAVLLEAMTPPVTAVLGASGKVWAGRMVDGLLIEVRRRVAATDGTVAAVEAALAVKETA